VQDPIITFEARSEWYGLEAKDVREVARLRGVRAVPRAPGVIAGLAEVHGRIVTLIDLERLLDTADGGPAAARAVPAGVAGAEAYGVVLALPFDHLGILVRNEVDVASAGGDVGPRARDEASWLQARLPVGDRLLNLLSVPALVARLEESIRAGFRPEGGGRDEDP